jgi:ABC-type transport system substrate-binding protein
MVLPNFGTAGIPRPENRWNGANRGTWTNAEFDRLIDQYNVTLDRGERIPLIARMVAIFSDELPSISLNFNPWITAHTAAVRGPQLTTPDSQATWNIHEWELR